MRVKFLAQTRNSGTLWWGSNSWLTGYESEFYQQCFNETTRGYITVQWRPLIPMNH